MKILEKINYLQLLFHFAATWFLMISFKKFSFLFDLKIIEFAQKYGPKYVVTNQEKFGLTPEDIAYFNFWPRIAFLIAILVSFIISIIISKVKGWPLINSFIVFIGSYILFRFNILDFPNVLSFSLNRFLNDYQFDFILVGSIFLFSSFFVFFSKYLNGFINKQYLKQERE